MKNASRIAELKSLSIEGYEAITKRIHAEGFNTYARAKMIKETATINKVVKASKVFATVTDSITKLGAIVLTTTILIIAANNK